MMHAIKTAAVFAAFILQIRAAPAPQDDIPDSSEVELVDPVNTNTKDSSEADHPVVVVVKPTSFGDVFAGFPGFGHFPTHFKTHFNSVPGFGRVPQTQQVSLDDIFGGDRVEPLTPTANNCGLLCKVFNVLEGHLGVFSDSDGTIRSKVHNNDEDSDYDNHTITYSEKVLPDGSVLKINKTVIQDSDENGNGFFFQSSVHHIFQDEDEEDEEIVGDVVLNDNEEPDLSAVDEAIDDTIVDIVENPEKLTVLDTIEDPSINEIFDE